MYKLRARVALSVAIAIATAVALTTAIGEPTAHAGTASFLPPIRHVFTIVLENQSWESVNSTNGRTSMPYLHSLEASGVLLNNMYGVSHASLTNYIAMTSGNAPTPKTKSDCHSYNCVYNAPNDANIGDQLEAAGLSWKAYMESMPAPCTHPTENTTDQYQLGYATRHNPFMYYRDVVSNPARCAAHDVPFDPAFANDLAANTLPNYSMIVPDTCDDAHDGGTSCGLGTADSWLAAHVPAILASPQYQADGMLVITFDESASTDTRYCCGDAAGGRIYTLVLSPFVQRPGTDDMAPLSHYSLLRTVEDVFGLPCLQHACDGHVGELSNDAGSVFGGPPPYDFTMTIPHVSLRAGSSAQVTVSTSLTNGADLEAVPISLSAWSSIPGVLATLDPPSIVAGGTATLTVTASSSAAPSKKSTIEILGFEADTYHSVPLPVDVVAAAGTPDQVQNGNFESGSTAPWTTPTGTAPTVVTPGFAGAGAARLVDNSSMAQRFVVPTDAAALTFALRVACVDNRNNITVVARDLTAATTTTIVAKQCTNTGAWQRMSTSAVGWRGHQLLLTFTSHRGVAPKTSIVTDADEVFVD